MGRTTKGKGDPKTFTWAELSQFYFMDKGKQTTYKIPTLEQYNNCTQLSILEFLSKESK
jgi:hypothetical protein